MLEVHLDAINKTNLLVKELKHNVNRSHEIHRISASEIMWAKYKKGNVPNRALSSVIFKKGYIYKFDFGKNFSPEMSYEHRGLVIGITPSFLYVLPICSKKQRAEHNNAYHPIHNPNGNKGSLFLMKKSDFPFLDHDSILKLDDMRTISKNRLSNGYLYGKITMQSKDYKLVEDLVHKRYFFDHAFEHEKVIKELVELKNEHSKLKVEYREIEQRCNELQKELEELKNK